MRNPILDVLDFHTLTEVTVALTPTSLSENRKKLRVSLINEEVNNELIPAIASDDVIETLDGAIDSIYVILGMLIERGLSAYFVAAWNEIHRSNMTKVDPDLGILKREDGKVLKPASYSKADLAKVISKVRHHEYALSSVFATFPEGEEYSPEAAKDWLDGLFDLGYYLGDIDLDEIKSWQELRNTFYSSWIQTVDKH